MASDASARARLVVDGARQQGLSAVVRHLDQHAELRQPLADARQRGGVARLIDQRRRVGVVQQVEQLVVDVAVVDVERRHAGEERAQHALDIFGRSSACRRPDDPVRTRGSGARRARAGRPGRLHAARSPAAGRARRPPRRSGGVSGSRCTPDRGFGLQWPAGRVRGSWARCAPDLPQRASGDHARRDLPDLAANCLCGRDARESADDRLPARSVRPGSAGGGGPRLAPRGGANPVRHVRNRPGPAPGIVSGRVPALRRQYARRPARALRRRPGRSHATRLRAGRSGARGRRGAHRRRGVGGEPPVGLRQRGRRRGRPAPRRAHAPGRRRTARHRLRRPGRSRAFVTAAHRGQNRPGDPQLTTPGVGRADVWVFDAARTRRARRRS